jgi:hypothetical protein
MFEGVPVQETVRVNRSEAAQELQRGIEQIATELNAFIAENLVGKKGDVVMVDEHAQLSMRAFITKKGGPYKKTEQGGGVVEDEEFVKEKEIEWSGVDNERVRSFLGHPDDEQKALSAWKQRQLEHDGVLGEMTLYTLLYKALKETHLVIRTAPYDDYANGVDTLVIEKDTGKVVCAFDEVVGAEDDANYAKKRRRIAQRGGDGFSVKYGLSVQDGCVIRTQLEGLVGVPLRIEKESLYTLLQNKIDSTEGLSAEERHILHTVLSAAATDAGEAGVGITSLLERVR